MTKHKAIHLRDDINRLYVTGKKGGRGLANIEDFMGGTIQVIKGYVGRNKERLMTAASNRTG